MQQIRFPSLDTNLTHISLKHRLKAFLCMLTAQGYQPAPNCVYRTGRLFFFLSIQLFDPVVIQAGISAKSLCVAWRLMYWIRFWSVCEQDPGRCSYVDVPVDLGADCSYSRCSWKTFGTYVWILLCVSLTLLSSECVHNDISFFVTALDSKVRTQRPLETCCWTSEGLIILGDLKIKLLLFNFGERIVSTESSCNLLKLQDTSQAQADMGCMSTCPTSPPKRGVKWCIVVTYLSWRPHHSYVVCRTPTNQFSEQALLFEFMWLQVPWMINQ